MFVLGAESTNLSANESGRAPIFLWLDKFWDSGCPQEIGYVLLALSKFADNDDLTAWPSRETLAHLTGKTVRSIDRNMTKAVEQGWVKRVEPGHRGKNTRYKLTVGARWNRKQDTHSAGSESKRASPVTESETQVTQNGDTDVPRTAHETTHETTHDPLVNRDGADLLANLGLANTFFSISFASFLNNNPYAEEVAIRNRASQIGATVGEIIDAIREEFGDERRMPDQWWDSIAAWEPRQWVSVV